MSRAVKIGGTVAALGAGYYFYQAGGDPKAAQKRFEGNDELSPPHTNHC
jgi:hypothetical protein